jgi:hypothetical protein
MASQNCNTPDDLISLAQACRLLPSRKPGRKMHVASLYRWVQRGKIQGWRVGSIWYVSERDVLAMIRPSSPLPEVASRAERERQIREAERRVRGG